MEAPIFILSTGRTGTQFFEDYINRTTDQAVCMHEPRPSRRFKFLSNLYLNGKISEQKISSIYQFSRKSLFNKVQDKIYVESSNFIFGCIPALNTSFGGVKVIHIVRDPVSYTISHLNHGFWCGHKKFFAKYVPYWLEKLEVEGTSNPVHLLSLRWNFVNQQIASYENTNAYIRIRFEDIFSNNPELASRQLNKVREFCGIPLLEEKDNRSWLGQPKNHSKEKYQLTTEDKGFILKNCNALMKAYGYVE